MATWLPVSIITLYINELNRPVKRDGHSGTKHDSAILCLLETHFKCNSIDKLKVKGWKWFIMQKLIKAGVAILISGKGEKENLTKTGRDII